MSSVTGDQEHELQRGCPSEVANRRKRTVRACTGDATKERRCFGHERGAPRDARDGFVTWIPTKTDRPAHPRWETSVEPQTMHPHGSRLGVLTGVDAAGAFLPLLIPWERQARNDSSVPRKHGGDPEGLRCWPRRSLLTHRTALASGGRAESERREAPSGRARSATEVRAEGLVPSVRWKMRYVRDGRGLSQRTELVRGPRIRERVTKTGSADGLRSE